jgi:hypothetical protein
MIGEIDVALPMVGRRGKYPPQKMGVVELRPDPPMPTVSKICGDCRRVLTTDDFGRDVHRVGGINRRCKRCNADRAKTYYVSKRRCSRCQERQPLSAFDNSWVCRECQQITYNRRSR